MSKGKIFGQSSRQILRAQAAERDNSDSDDEGIVRVTDPIAACVEALNQNYPDGSEHGLVFMRSLSGELSIMLSAYKHPQAQTIFVDCPEDAKRKAKIHENLRRQTNQLVLVPVSADRQKGLIPYVEANEDADLFVYDEGAGWTYEPNIIGHLSDNTETSLAA